jgi:hypothetical protein
MPKTTFSIRSPRTGQTHKRSTERAYTHVVLYWESPAFRAARAEREAFAFDRDAIKYAAKGETENAEWAIEMAARYRAKAVRFAAEPGVEETSWHGSYNNACKAAASSPAGKYCEQATVHAVIDVAS